MILRSLALPLPPLFGISWLSVFIEKKLPFGERLSAADRKVLWGEALFRFLWGMLFFDLIPAWLFFLFRPEPFSSIIVTALAAAAVIFLLGFIPLTILLAGRNELDWGEVTYTLFWVFAALSISLWGIQQAYRI